MVLLDPKSNPKATYTFLAEIWTFDGKERAVKHNY
jgi:hypothetical protein